MNEIFSLLDKYKILVAVCDEKEQEEMLISLITEYVENDAYTDCERNVYQKKIDYIDPERIDSALKVRDYLIFYSMISKNYNVGILEEQLAEFCKFRQEDIMDKYMNEISNQDKIAIRCLISYMRRVKILFGKNFLKQGTDEEKEWLTMFLKKYFVENSSYCILFEDNKSMYKICM